MSDDEKLIVQAAKVKAEAAVLLASLSKLHGLLKGAGRNHEANEITFWHVELGEILGFTTEIVGEE